MARILIGVSGGIAAYKAVELARLATLAGHGVRVTMTDAAARFVGPATFEGITGAPVLTDEFSRDPMRGTYPGEGLPAHDPISHLAVVAGAGAFVVAPASANTLAKLATGICDSFLTTSFLACTAPRIVAPAMNERMWEAEATRANVATLRERGVARARAGGGGARLAWRAGDRADARAHRDPRRDRGRRSPVPGAISPAAGCSSAPAAPVSRSTRSASSAIARAAGWGSHSPRRPPAAAPT